MKKTFLFTILFSIFAFSDEAYILSSRMCNDGSIPQDTIINSSISLNLTQGIFRQSGILDQGTSMSKPYVVETKAELTSSSLILFNAQSFDAGDSVPRFNAERISMTRTPGKMEFSYNSNPNSDGSCKKGIPMIFVFSPAPY